MPEFGRQSRGRWVLSALIAGQLLLLAYQVRRPEAGSIRLIRLWSAEAVLPAEKLSQHMVSGIRNWSEGYVMLRHTHEQNQRLQQQVTQLELQNQQLRQAVRDLPHLDALLGFHRTFALSTEPAQVISHGASPDAQAIYLNQGRRQGLRRNMAVITPQGLVGKLSQVLATSAQVLLITDPESGVGVLIGNQEFHGILRGLGAGAVEVDRVLKNEAVKAGDEVVTSGEDQVYPKGLPVGTVTGVLPSHDGIFKVLTIKPAAELGRLQNVLVVTAQLPAPAESQEAGLTAADVREGRLPGLPQPASGIAAGRNQQNEIAVPTPPPVIAMPAAAAGPPKAAVKPGGSGGAGKK
ncbi:MAG: rod shape-determining protein MreC [Terriglobales bacterium]